MSLFSREQPLLLFQGIDESPRNQFGVELRRIGKSSRDIEADGIRRLLFEGLKVWRSGGGRQLSCWLLSQAEGIAGHGSGEEQETGNQGAARHGEPSGQMLNGEL